MYCSACQAIGHSGTTTIRKINVKAERTSVSAISFGRALPDGALDQRDHAIEERFAGAAGDADDDPVGDDRRAAGDARAVAARFANHRGRFAGDRRFVDRGDAFDDFAVAGNDLPGLDHDPVARLQIGRRNLLDSVVRSQVDRPPCRGGCGAATRPAPCRGPRPARWRNWRTAPSETARRRAR